LYLWMLQEVRAEASRNSLRSYSGQHSWARREL